MWSVAHSAYSREHAVVISVDEVAAGVLVSATWRRLGTAATSARADAPEADPAELVRRGGPGTGRRGVRPDAEPGDAGRH
jgi:hypothetical protein